MCGKSNYNEEALEFDFQLLQLFRVYEVDVKAELSSDEMESIAQEQLMKSFLESVKHRLPEALERDQHRQSSYVYSWPIP